MLELSAALGVPPHRVDADAPLPQLGLDSLIAMEIKNRMRERFGMNVAVGDLMGDLSLNQLASKLGLSPDGKTMAAAAPRRRRVTGEI